MSGMLIDGSWEDRSKWEKGKDGSFRRQESFFRDTISQDGPFPPASKRYHLYVSYACPWAHRTLISRALLGLEESIGVSVVHHHMAHGGWPFDADADPDSTVDHLHGASFLHELYSRADSEFTGRVTVPVLWDRETNAIVNNESREILRMFSQQMAPLGRGELDLCPTDLEQQIDRHIDSFYERLNNGVYKCGFAGTQQAYERAFGELFECLDELETHLGSNRYLCGDRLTEADICLFTTLVRFDPVYYVHFKCNGRLIQQYANLSGFVKDLYQTPGVRETVNLRHIKHHYYGSHAQINPTRFVPKGPDVGWYEQPHGRAQ